MYSNISVIRESGRFFSRTSKFRAAFFKMAYGKSCHSLKLNRFAAMRDNTNGEPMSSNSQEYARTELQHFPDRKNQSHSKFFLTTVPIGESPTV